MRKRAELFGRCGIQDKGHKNRATSATAGVKRLIVSIKAVARFMKIVLPSCYHRATAVLRFGRCPFPQVQVADVQGGKAVRQGL